MGEDDLMTAALPPNVEEVLQVLQQAVTAELGRKRRLGHYYFMGENGQAVSEGPDAPQPEP